MRRRRALLIPGLLALGALTSVLTAAAAWWLAEHPPVGFNDKATWLTAEPDEHDRRWWREAAGDDWPDEPFRFKRSRSVGIRRQAMVAVTNPLESAPPDVDLLDQLQAERVFWLTRLDCGWPLPCVRREDVRTFRGRLRERDETTGLTIGRCNVPVDVLWGGLVLDTLAHAGMLGALAWGPVLALRLVRVGRGRCPMCAYDLRGVAGCPECGWRR